MTVVRITRRTGSVGWLQRVPVTVNGHARLVRSGATQEYEVEGDVAEVSTTMGWWRPSCWKVALGPARSAPIELELRSAATEFGSFDLADRGSGSAIERIDPLARTYSADDVGGWLYARSLAVLVSAAAVLLVIVLVWGPWESLLMGPVAVLLMATVLYGSMRIVVHRRQARHDWWCP